MKILNEEQIISKATNAANIFLENAWNIYGRKILSTDEIIKVVKEKYGIYLVIKQCSFKKLKSPADNSGALMRRKNKREFEIIINTDQTSCFQRFSLIHEIGHIITNCFVSDFENDGWVISTNISCTTPISLGKTKNAEYESIANVFALKTLIPMELLLEHLKNGEDICRISHCFLTSPEAVLTRIQLGQ